MVIGSTVIEWGQWPHPLTQMVKLCFYTVLCYDIAGCIKQGLKNVISKRTVY